MLGKSIRRLVVVIVDVPSASVFSLQLLGTVPVSINCFKQSFPKNALYSLNNLLWGRIPVPFIKKGPSIKKLSAATFLSDELI